MTSSFKKMVVKSFEGKLVEEILEASPAALHGVSPADASMLEAAFGIRTIRQMAEHKFFRYAISILAASGSPDYDPGPPPEWQAFFASAPLAHYIDHPSERFRTEFGPVFYRGRLDGTARALIIGQDPATDELIASRAFVGRSGQRLQGLLGKIGLSRSYVMVNTFLFGVYGQFNPELTAISLEPELLNYRNKYLDRLARGNDFSVVLTIGAGARHALSHWPGREGYEVHELVHPAAPESLVLPDWNQHLPALVAALDPDEGVLPDSAPYGTVFLPSDEVRIPRFDLPFGMPDWHGTGGSRSKRDGPQKIIWNAAE